MTFYPSPLLPIPIFYKAWNVPEARSIKLESNKYLFDIKQAADLNGSFARSKTFKDFQAEPMFQLAVARQFEINGESLNQLSKIDLETAAKISEYRRIIPFRNILIHGYAQIDDRLVRGVLESKLPMLLEEVAALLDD